MHNEKAHGVRRSVRFHHALAAGETITGLIMATTLVYPDKKLRNGAAVVTPVFVNGHVVLPHVSRSRDLSISSHILRMIPWTSLQG